MQHMQGFYFWYGVDGALSGLCWFKITTGVSATHFAYSYFYQSTNLNVVYISKTEEVLPTISQSYTASSNNYPLLSIDLAPEGHYIS